MAHFQTYDTQILLKLVMKSSQAATLFVTLFLTK